MTVLEKWKQDGRVEGRIELIMTMLSNGIDPMFIAKNTGVSLDEIKALQIQNVAIEKFSEY